MLLKNYILMLMLFVPIFLIGQSFTKIITGPIATTSGDHRSVNWIDYNNDGYNDLMITAGPQAGANNLLFKNKGDGTFEKITGDPIVSDGAPSDGATWADMDNDGDIDCFVVNWYGKNNLMYTNNGNGTFTQVFTGKPVTDGGYSETASWGDYDKDGLVDLYVTNSEGAFNNFLYHNDGGGAFTKITIGKIVTDKHTSRSINWTDLDNDGDLDAFVSNESGQKEDLYQNNGLGMFDPVTTGVLVNNGGNTMTSSVADYDNDGDLDVFLGNDNGSNGLFRNEGGLNFTKMTADTISKLIGHTFGSNFGDIDNDGDEDLLITSSFGSGKLKNNLYINNGNGTFSKDNKSVIVTDEGWSYGCAFGDYDNDGFLDAATGNCYGANQANSLYHNDGNANNWIEIKCKGVLSNRSAIGAKIKLRAVINGKVVWQQREISAQSGYCGQNMLTVHFGIGDAETIDTIKIEWPSGIIDIYTNFPGNKISTAIEGESLTSTGDIKTPDTSYLINYPNPFTLNTIIEFQLTNSSHVELSMYNLKGSLIQTLIDKQMPVGKHTLDWNAAVSGITLSSGIYILGLKTNDQIITRRLVYIK